MVYRRIRRRTGRKIYRVGPNRKMKIYVGTRHLMSAYRGVSRAMDTKKHIIRHYGSMTWNMGTDGMDL